MRYTRRRALMQQPLRRALLCPNSRLPFVKTAFTLSPISYYATALIQRDGLMTKGEVMIQRQYRLMIATGLAMGLTLTACSGNAPAGTEDKGAAAGTAPSTTAAGRDDAGVRAAVTALFAPYSTPTQPSVQDRAIYSAATTTLVNQWKAMAPGDEPTYLGEFDWLCQCQDWESTQFRVTSQEIAWTSDTAATVTVNYTPMTDTNSTLRVMMVREGDAWKVADMAFADNDKPLTTHLREEIAAAAAAAR